ncbi:unnamed protein product [Caenorhabditis brenneri]
MPVDCRTHKARELNEYLVAAEVMRVRHVKGQYEKEGILLISERTAKTFKFGPLKRHGGKQICDLWRRS